MKNDANIEAAIAAFFTSYLGAFELGDTAALAGHIAYPLHVSSHGGVLAVRHSPADYVTSLQPLFAAYRKLGVAKGVIAKQSVTVLGEALAQSLIHWEVKDRAQRTLYTHEASYTLVAREGRWRIGAIAFNEIAKLKVLGAP